MKPKILFGTNNPHKLREIRQLIGDQYEVLSLADIGLDKDVDETEDTLSGNAILKARSFFESSHIPCFSDDTGLEVKALNGAPGVYSARYAGPACSPEDNIQKMLGELSGVREREARFRTVIAFFDGKNVKTFDGTVNGTITESKRGNNGFGYDPIFQPDGFAETFAELPPETKNEISHRGKAIRAFSRFILDDHQV